ncbi:MULTISPECIES: hypothetical protein [unclassified Flavobacterium]|uniref:hypothetical protein n=1 Tax=unclassified Flavobacterium TaxID=196869 RepID=UPI001F13436E|nr:MULTISPECIES: hypothetical protein [unclassified Flavobacterium]UMY65109.1 hypothetical protein MKO97_11395 [Flavobacterium sp. HJ-32-4]
MNGLDKMEEMTGKQDTSAELKKGAIKQILIQTAGDVLPDFEFVSYKDNCYSFLRQRKLHPFTVYEILHLSFTLRGKNVSCSIASRLNPGCLFFSEYNTGLLNPHRDLKMLKPTSGALPIQDAYYFHNGQVETTTLVVKEIFDDFKEYGLPFLDKQMEQLTSNSIVKLGLAYIDGLQIDKQQLKAGITEELNKGGYLLSSIQHPIYIDLKEKLLSVSGQSREDRRLIPKTAHELLELYWMR